MPSACISIAKASALEAKCVSVAASVCEAWNSASLETFRPPLSFYARQPCFPGRKIRGGQSLRGAEIDSHSDHRIAMAFAVAALRAEGETQILGAESAAISYPAFFETLEALAER